MFLFSQYISGDALRKHIKKTKTEDLLCQDSNRFQAFHSHELPLLPRLPPPSQHPTLSTPSPPCCSIDKGEPVGPMQVALAISHKALCRGCSTRWFWRPLEEPSLAMPIAAIWAWMEMVGEVGRRGGGRILEQLFSMLPATCQQDGASWKIIKALES